jgi:protocatechuate 3,4-dioxygenase beta subunit
MSALALACLSHGAKPLDARIAEQLPARLRSSATIRLVPNVSTPCVFGLFRPCILLPEFLMRTDRAQQMIFALAHEASHILRGDLWSWRLVRVGQFALWFQPAYWWLRRQTRLCQDFLADQDAAMLGKPADLADFLVQLARVQQSRLTVPALSMRSHRKDLFRRINMLLDPHSQLEHRCPRRFQAILALAVFAIIGMAALLRLEAQDLATEAKPKESQSLAGRESNTTSATEVQGRVVGPDGKPASGAKLYLGSVSKWKGDDGRRIIPFDREETKSAVRATSDTDGHFAFTYSNAELMKIAHIDSRDIDIRDVIGEVMAVAPGHGCGWAEIDGAARELTIHLVDDLPAEGRILDSDGHPVAGARIRTIGIGAAPWEDLGASSMTLRKGEVFAFSKVWNGSLPGEPSIITTGRDGRFRLSGVGRDRLVRIRIEGPAIATAFSWVITRTAGTLNGRESFFGSFDFVGQPSRLITGTVRNKAAGTPLPGVSVSLGGRSGLIKGVTDENGHYELRGAPKASTYQLVAAPGDGLFFERKVKLQDTPGLDSLRCDIDLVNGLTVHGRVTEKETGKPVAGAQVDYHPVGGNSHPNKLLPGFWNPRSETTALADGSYTLTIMPGPGVIGVKGPKRDAYAPAVATQEERRRFFKTPSVFSSFFDTKDDNFLSTAAGGGAMGAIGVDSYNALVLIEPGEDEHAIVRDVSLERPHELRGRILGPDNQPLRGTTVYGLERLGVETLKGSEFTVRGVNPKAKRSLVFYHKEKQLGYYLKEIDAKSAEPLTVKLERCGSASGRILEPDGQPATQAEVHVMGNTFPVLWEAGGGDHRVVTDANGRFHVDGLVGGQQYSVGDRISFYAIVTVEAGHHKDFGDIKMAQRDQ